MRLFLLIRLIVSSNSLAHMQRVHDHIADLQSTTHSDLAGLNISLFTIQDPAYFFISNFTWKRAVFGSDQYRIGVNSLTFEQSISDDALKGILAHELIHTEDYLSGSTLGTLVPIGLKISFKKSRIQYERKTHLKTIQKGFADGLIAYKEFQYPLLTKKELATKKQEYLTPQEIEFVKELEAEVIEEWIKYDAPLNLKQMKVHQWFRSQYPDFEMKRVDMKDGYQLKISGKAKRYNIIPVTRHGILKFAKSFSMKSGSKTLKPSRSIVGYLIYSKGQPVLHLMSP